MMRVQRNAAYLRRAIRGGAGRAVGSRMPRPPFVDANSAFPQPINNNGDE